MAGLDPAIHADATDAGGAGGRVDARVGPGHDDFSISIYRTALRAGGRVTSFVTARCRDMPAEFPLSRHRGIG
jgi:hypothetical protein